MRTVRHPLLQMALFFAGALVTLTGCAKEEALAIANAPYVKPEGWASECVGRIRVDVPQPIDFGAAEPDWVPEARTHYNFAGLKNQPFGGWGTVIITKTEFFETFPLPNRDAFDYVEGPASGHFETRSRAIRKRTQKLENFQPHSFAWRSGETFDFGIYLPQDKRVRLLHGYMDEDLPEEERGSAEKAKAILTTLWPRYRVRTPGEIPTDAGICTPYGFFADPKGMTERDYRISMPFRHTKSSNLILGISTETVNKEPDAARIEDWETPWGAEDKMVQKEKDKCRSTSATTGSIVSGCLFAGAKSIKSHEEVEYLTLADGQRARLLVMEVHPSINNGAEYEIMLETLGVKDSATQPRLTLSATGISSRVPVPGMQGNQPPPIKEAIALIRTMAQSLRLRDGAVAKDAPVKDSLTAFR